MGDALGKMLGLDRPVRMKSRGPTDREIAIAAQEVKRARDNLRAAVGTAVDAAVDAYEEANNRRNELLAKKAGE